MKRPLPNWLKLRALKANRLKAKDRIISLLSRHRPRQVMTLAPDINMEDARTGHPRKMVP